MWFAPFANRLLPAIASGVVFQTFPASGAVLDLSRRSDVADWLIG